MGFLIQTNSNQNGICYQSAYGFSAHNNQNKKLDQTHYDFTKSTHNPHLQPTKSLQKKHYLQLSQSFNQTSITSIKNKI